MACDSTRRLSHAAGTVDKTTLRWPVGGGCVRGFRSVIVARTLPLPPGRVLGVSECEVDALAGVPLLVSHGSLVRNTAVEGIVPL